MNAIRLRYKIPKASVERHSELIANNWVQLREPYSMWLYTLVSIPLMFLNAFISIKILGLTGIYWTANSTYSPDKATWVSNEIIEASTTTQSFSMEAPHFLVIIGLILVMILIHEFLHLIFLPNFLTSNKASIGISYYGYGFTYTEDIMSKTRYILMLLAPFLIISVVLPIILKAFGLLNPLLILWILFNAMGSCVDILALIIILIQAPAGAFITMNGIRTYWKRRDPDSAGV